ncbi:MAG: C25 family cysteine peptidase [candidate division WOR-3 bacterium]
MKKFVLSFLIFLTVFSLNANITVYNVSESKTSLYNAIDIYKSTFEFELDKFYVEKDGLYDILKIDGFDQFSFQEGYPSLPFIVKNIALPDEGDLDYKIEIIEEIEVTGNFNIKPFQPPVFDIPGFKPEFVKDDYFYSLNQFYPSNNITILDPTGIRDVRFSKVYFTPFRYNPVTKKLKLIKKARILFFVNNFKSTNPITNSPFLTEEFVPLYREFLSNFDAVLKFKKIETLEERSKRIQEIKKSQKGDNFSAPGDYLIVVGGTTLSTKIKTFATYKAKLGYNPVIMHLPNYSSSILIKDSIQYAYNNWSVKPVYILIVGDADSTRTPSESWVVMRPLWKDFRSVYNYGIKAGYVPNDHWFACLNDTNYYPDAYISRFNVKDTITLNNIVNKTIKYETNPQLTGNTDWFTTYVGVGGYESGRIFDTTATRVWKNYLKPYGWTDWDSLIETATWSPGRATVSDSINDGQNFILFRGHGAEGYDGDSDDGKGFGWMGGANQNYKDLYTNEDIAIRANGYMGGFVFAPTCLAGNYAYPNDTNSMGDYWTHLSSTNGGVGYFGATNVSFSYYNDSMSLGIGRAFANYNNEMPDRTFGKVTNYGKLYMETYAGTVTYFRLENYLMNTLGDPAVRIWTKIPKNLIVSHDASVQTRTDTITVTVTDNTKAVVSGATVCLYDTLETPALQIITTTDATGKATIITNYTKTGNAFLTVSKQDYIPYMGTVTVNQATELAEISFTGKVENGKVILNWNVSNPVLVDKYKVYKNNKEIATLENTKNEFKDLLLSNETKKIEYKLEVYYLSGKKTEYKLPLIIDAKKSVQFFENKLYLSNIENLVIYNVSGQKVKEYSINKTSALLDLSNLSSGFYIVKADNLENRKILIVK